MKSRFPKDFMWGAAASAYQVEGNNSFSDWWEWEKKGNTDPSGQACDHYNRYEEDFLIASGLGHNSHRLGLEWSRLEKEKGTWDQAEWDHYIRVLDKLIDLGIEPIVTLNHFTLPLWLSREGGWTVESTVDHFTRFSEKAIKELGHRAQYWITINEPNILAMLAYYKGIWTPCKKNLYEALSVLRNMLKAHVSAYQNMYECARLNPLVRDPKIGIAKAVTAFHVDKRFSVLDHMATGRRKDFHNHSFIDSLIQGYISLPGLNKKKLPAKKTLDFIGLNYYFRQFIRHQRPADKHPFGEVASLGTRRGAGKTSDMGWEIYPRGLYEVLMDFKKYRIPLIVAENGLSTDDDQLRKSYIKDHLLYVSKAIRKGAPVFGYLHWSLMDNFEWAEAYNRRFGLVHVDFKTMKRTLKSSAEYYASIIKDPDVLYQ